MSDLREYIENLLILFNQWTIANTSWSEIAIVEEAFVIRDGMKHVSIPRAALVTPEEYATRFDELMGRGYHWLNMNAAGVVHGVLIILIELPNYVSEIKGRTSVNFSGPYIRDGKSQWDASSYITVID